MAYPDWPTERPYTDVWHGSEKEPYAPLVRYEECGREVDVQAHAVGWVAFRVELADDPDEPEVVVYCPECAAGEFQDRGPRTAR